MLYPLYKCILNAILDVLSGSFWAWLILSKARSTWLSLIARWSWSTKSFFVRLFIRALSMVQPTGICRNSTNDTVNRDAVGEPSLELIFLVIHCYCDSKHLSNLVDIKSVVDFLSKFLSHQNFWSWFWLNEATLGLFVYLSWQLQIGLVHVQSLNW